MARRSDTTYRGVVTAADASPDGAEQRRIALDLLLEGWEKALARGAAPDVLASTAMFLALSDMVDSLGAEAVARMVDDLPTRVRAGEFTLGDER
jgi:hypothetical protein